MGILVPVEAMAERSITLPFVETFDDTTYESDLVRVSGDGSQTHSVSGSWDGSGYARFQIATSADTYNGVGSFVGLNVTSLCVRYVIRIPTSMLAHLEGVQEPKLMIWVRNPPYDGDTMYRMIHWWNACSDNNLTYPLMITGTNNSQMVPPACTDGGGYAVSSDGPDWICSRQGNGLLPDFSWDDWTEQWVSVEVCADITAEATADGSLRIIVSTQDGTFDNTVVLQPECGVGHIGSGSWGVLDLIGMYGGGAPASYYDMDDLVVSENPVGPPAGFFIGGGDTTAPALSSPDPAGTLGCE